MGCCTFIGLVAVLAKPWTDNSDLVLALAGAFAGAITIPAFIVPASTPQEWRSLLPYSIVFGLIVGSVAALKLGAPPDDPLHITGAEPD
jgi:hypothetical protein